MGNFPVATPLKKILLLPLGQPQEEAALQTLPTPCQVVTDPGHLLAQALCRYPVSLALQGHSYQFSPQGREECPNYRELAGEG